MDQKFLRRVDRGIPTVDIEFRSGCPLWTQHHCVISSKTTVDVLLVHVGAKGRSGIKADRSVGRSGRSREGQRIDFHF